jgi:transcriptional regulator with XRE-family HTH domain
VRHSDTVPALLRELGQQLAALRREAGLTQENLGALAGFSRSTVSVAEIGRQPHAREFWAACDKALDSGGVLAAGFDQIDAVREAEERAAPARRRRHARPARWPPSQQPSIATDWYPV